jgi:predicted alpha/beta-fold hydrolase
LSSYDDPFIDVNNYLKANWSDSVHLSLQKYGGHMGYFNKYRDSKYGRRWLDHYLESVFGQIEKMS